MEMEAPPKPPRLVVEEDALASRVLEIIGGVTLEALQTLEQPEERDVWPMEEGDDSVFYSDEDQALQDIKASTSCDFGASKCRRLVNSVTADEPSPQREDDLGEESIIDKENSEMENDVTQQVNLTEQGEERQELQTSKSEPMDQSDAADPGAQSDQTPETSVSRLADVQTQPEQNISAEKANLPVEKEEVVLDAQTPKFQPFDVTTESITRLNGKAEVPQQMSSAELQISGDRQLQVEREPEQQHDVHTPAGFHQNPSPGYSTLPASKKSGLQKSFDHLSSNKYSTVSYRKIRRGNTRQKIKDFEVMMMNL